MLRVFTANLELKLMICGSMRSQIVNPYGSAPEEIYGSIIVENALIAATLDSDDSLLWTFWDPSLPRASVTSARASGQLYETTRMRSRFHHRTAVLPLSALGNIGAAEQHVFTINAPRYGQLAEVRAALSCEHLPICCLGHALRMDTPMSAYSWMVLNSREEDTFIATSSSARSVIESTFSAVFDRLSGSFGVAKASFHPPRVVTLPFGVDIPAESSLDTDAARTLLEIPMNALVILYLGRLSEEYKADLDVLLLAVAKLSRQYPDIVLLLAGQVDKENYTGHLNKHIHALGLSPNVLIIPNFPEVLKSAIYSAADVFVMLADSIQETFGVAILEAMAHGLPIVASDWSGYRDIVLEGETGILVRTVISPERLRVASMLGPLLESRPLAHYIAQGTIVDFGALSTALQMLATDRNKRRAFGAAGRLHAARNYSWRQVAPRFIDLWKEQQYIAKHYNTKHIVRPGFEDIFTLFATTVLSPQDEVRVSDSWDLMVENLYNHWDVSDRRFPQKITSLLQYCSERSASISDLLSHGWEEDIIIWAAKKGLCCIMPHLTA